MATSEQWAAAKIKYETTGLSGAKIAARIGVSGAALSQMASRHKWVRFNANGIKAKDINVKPNVVDLKVFSVGKDGKIKHEKKTDVAVTAALETERQEIRSINSLMEYEIDSAGWKEWSSHPDAMQQFIDYMMAKGIDGSLRGFCREKRFGVSAMHSWITRDPELSGRYAEARKGQADVFFDQLLGVAMAEPERADDGKIDPSWVQHRRLIVDTMKWGVAKLKPEAYGDQTNVHITGNVTQTLDRSALQEEIMKLAGRGMRVPLIQDVTDVEPKA